MVTRRKPRLPDTISAAKFKARCLELMDVVATTGSSIVVTKRGRPVAQLSPIRSPATSALGFMKGRIRIVGDIVAPIDATWDADA